jgi:hypothetical protein
MVHKFTILVHLFPTEVTTIRPYADPSRIDVTAEDVGRAAVLNQKQKRKVQGFRPRMEEI